MSLQTWHTDSAGFSSSLLSAHIFYPKIIFLNENYDEIQWEQKSDYEYSTWWSTSGLELDINMSEVPSAEYMLIYTDPADVGKTYRVTPGGITVMSGSGFVSSGAQSYDVPLNYEGVLNIKLTRI